MQASPESSLVTEVAKAVPALLVLAWIVHRFLGALKERDEGFHSLLKEATSVQKETNQTLGRVNSSLDQMDQTLGHTRRVLHETQEVILNCPAAPPRPAARGDASHG